jgi:NAD(P)-dependent dehydrogenase (short-subunit alcohol dehydrogenase family)
MKDYFGYEGTACVVTGASAGMGKTVAEMLVDFGADVYALSRSEPDVEGIKLWIPTDLGDRGSIDNAFAQLPERIDRFFGIAGLSGVAHSYDETFAVDFIGNKYLTETYLMERMADGGALVFMTSTAGIRWARPDLIEEYRAIVEADGWDATVQAIADLDQSDNGGVMAYMMAKRAMNFYATSKAADFAKRDIRVNFVMPCTTSTRFIAEFMDVTGRDESALRYAIGNGKGFARPEAMGKAAVYLNSDLAEYVSGHGLNVDFGLEGATLVGQVPDMLGMNLV